MTLSLAKKIGGFTLVGTSRVCINGRSRKDKCSHGKPKSIGRVCISMQPIYHRSKSREELL